MIRLFFSLLFCFSVSFVRAQTVSGGGGYAATTNGGLTLTGPAFSLGDGVGITYATPGQLSLIGATPLFVVGANSFAAEDSTIQLSTTKTTNLAGAGSHGLGDQNVYEQTSGSGGYSTIDCLPTVQGVNSDNHYRCLQSRPTINLTSATISEVSAVFHQPNIQGTTTLSNSYGINMPDAAGTGTITNQIEVYMPATLVRGSNNYFLYNAGATPSYLGTGVTQIGTGGTLRFPSSFSTYGALLSHDGYGNVLDNPFFTIINGVLTISYTGAASVLASGSSVDMKVGSTTGNVLLQTGGVTGLAVALSTHLVQLPTISSDATHTDASICEDTTTHTLYSGSGTLGICLGTSSARYKRGIGDLSTGLDIIEQLKPKRYFLDAKHGDPTKPYYGFLAEDGVAVVPELIGLDDEGNPNTFDYLGLVPILVRAVQEQQMEIAALRGYLR